MKLTLNGYVLTDKDRQLLVRGSQIRQVTLTNENSKNIPVFFKSAKQAAMCVATNKMKFSRSAETYCKLYRVRTNDLSTLLHPTPCTISIDF